MKSFEDVRLVLAGHKVELLDRFRVKRVGVFGSYVRGDQKKNSDIDLLVEFNEPVSLLGVVKVENYLGDILGIKADVVPKRDIRPELRKRILKEAIYI